MQILSNLSVIIITRNEAKNIRACLQSVDFAKERIIVDAHSEDDTVSLAKAEGALVTETKDWPGFGIQKQRALAQVSTEWVLSIDADERVSKDLAQEIINCLQYPQYAAYALPRLSSFCGYFIRHGGWYPDYVIRLFRRDAGQFSENKVHERLIINAQHSIGRLQNPLIHYSYVDDSSFLRKLEHYSTVGAEEAFFQGKRCTYSSVLVHAIAAFIRSYFLKCGFLDGCAGLMVAISAAESSYHKYLKLMLLSRS